MDRFSFVGAAKIWGDPSVVKVLKSGVVVFPLFKSDVGVVVVVGPTTI
jgi:hypothetical protein